MRGRKFLLAALVGACGAAWAGSEVTVKVAKPEMVSESDSYVCVGRVCASTAVKISARVTGTLWECKGDEGDKVKKGDLLFRIEDTVYKANLQTAQAKLAELEAKLKMAETEVARYAAGEAKGGVSKIELDRAILNRDVLKAEISAAQANVTLCQNDLDYCTIRSPIDGVLGCGAFDPGNNVGPGSGTLRDVLAVDPIDVTVAVSERQMIHCFDTHGADGVSGENLRTKIVLLRSDGKPYPIKLAVRAIDNKVAAATGTVQIRLRGSNADGGLIPGAYVKLLVSEIYETPRRSIPLSAVVFEGDDRYVFVVADGKARKRKVELGDQTDNRIFVEKGLEEDETIAIAGVHKLYDGVAVKVD